MPMPIQISGFFNYDCTETQDGKRLHIISYKHDWTPGVVSVSIAVNFGSTHLSCIDSFGEVKTFPVGMAHFMEHFLFWLHFDDVLLPLVYKYYHDPNAVVTYDRTIWFQKKAWVAESDIDERPNAESVCNIVQSLLSVLTAECRESKIASLIEKTKNDVENEIGERNSDLTYRMRSKLMSALYREDPVRYDILGTAESLGEIELGHVDLAMKLIRANIESVTVLGYRLSDSFIAKIKETVLALLLKHSPAATIRPILPKIELMDVNAVNDRTWNYYGDSSNVLLGIKLLPLQKGFPAREDFKRMYLMSHLAMNHMQPPVRGIISPHARAYFMQGYIEDGFFFWDKRDLLNYMAQLKDAVAQRLRSYQRNFDAQAKHAMEKLLSNPYRLLKLCHAADLSKCGLTELTDVFEALCPRDVEQLVSELYETDRNMSMIYTTGVEDF
ncbi:MAG TPA: hypothetical protein VF290_19235 [Pyrinomonadaceae bacterium]